MIYLPTFDSVSLSGDDFENLCDPGKIKHSRVDNRLEKGRHATCDPACFDTEIFLIPRYQYGAEGNLEGMLLEQFLDTKNALL